MKRFNFLLFLPMILLVAIACSGCAEQRPASPVETFKTYVSAYKKKDITTMKLLLSDETLKMHEQQAKSEGVTLDDVVKRDSLLGEGQTTVEYRNERIEGNKATVEYKNSFGAWETVPFVLEDNEWKIDKKGYADQMMRDIEQNSQQFEDKLNQDRQPY